MKTNILLLALILSCVSLKAGTNDVPTFIITSEDVIPGSVLKHPAFSQNGTNRFTVKFQFNESGSNRARAFTAAHQNQQIRDVIGTFATPPVLLQITNTTGRNGYHGITEADANAIVDALKKK